MNDAVDQDSELNAMKTVFSELSTLPKDAQIRVIKWVSERLAIAVPTNVQAAVVENVTKILDKPQTSLREGTVDGVLRAIGGESARRIMLAAAVHLTLFQGKERFSREELVATSKDARAWKSDSINQVGINITRMLDAGELTEKAKHQYMLSSKTLEEMESKLAE